MDYKAMKYAGIATAFAGFAFGLTAEGINGKTIVSLVIWVAGVVIALRARKLAFDAELEDVKVEYYAQGHRDGGVDAGITRMNSHR